MAAVSPEFSTPPTMALITLLGLFAGGSLIGASVLRPRLLLYLIFALVPTQFLFVAVSDFFVSPADVLVLGGGVGLIVRLLVGERRTWTALVQHRYLGLMVLAYIAGFLVLGVSSRTLVRVVIAILPSILARELLRTRRHLVRAATALVAAGVIEAAYGAVYYARGASLHPTRFSGMSGVDFSAMVILAAAVIGFALLGRTRQPVKLAAPSLLAAFGLATLSFMGALAFMGAVLTVLWRSVAKANRFRLALVFIVLVGLALSQGAVRERLRTRNTPLIQADGVARTSADVRRMIFRTAWRTFTERPVFGIGYSRFLEYSLTDREINASTMGGGYYTHSTYVEILVEGGLLAFLLFIMHFAQYARGARSALWVIARERDVAVAASMVGLPVVLVSAAMANVLLNYSFWSICGLSLACINILQVEARGVLSGPHSA